MRNSPVSSQAASAREGARKGNGEFGAQERESTSVDLGSKPGVSLEASGEFEAWKSSAGRREAWHAFIYEEDFSQAISDCPAASRDELITVVERRAKDDAQAWADDEEEFQRSQEDAEASDLEAFNEAYRNRPADESAEDFVARWQDQA